MVFQGHPTGIIGTYQLEFDKVGKNMSKSLLEILDNTNEGKCFVLSDALKGFIEFKPKVMDMHVLATGHYNPSDLDNDLKTKAEEKHMALMEGYS